MDLKKEEIKDSTITLMQTLVNTGTVFEDFELSLEIISNHIFKTLESTNDGEEEIEEHEICDNCDSPDVCADYGCAIKSGLKAYPWDNI